MTPLHPMPALFPMNWQCKYSATYKRSTVQSTGMVKRTSATTVLDSGSGEGALYYSSLLTLDTRLFVNLQQRFLGKTWARNARVTLALSNIYMSRERLMAQVCP